MFGLILATLFDFLTQKTCYYSIHSIEYADMQLISEVYDLLKVGMCWSLHEIFPFMAASSSANT